MITSAGLYPDIDINRYHRDANLCDGPSISSSGLKMVAECPAKYWAFSPYNPKRFPPKETKAFDFGKAAHALVLGEPEFKAHFIISPYDDFRSKEAREWREIQTKTIVKADDFTIVRDMTAAQRINAAVMNAFVDGKPEQSLIWKDKETGIWLRSRPDWLPDDPTLRWIVDYKTAVSIEPRKLSVDAFKFGYPLQAAMQIDAVEIILGVKPVGIGHVVQEKTPPYLADLRLFTAEQLDIGRTIYRRALRRFADCMETGIWPGYTTQPQYFSTPKWIETETFDDDDGNDAG